MTTILAIDPGSERSAWLFLGKSGRPVWFGIDANDLVLEELRPHPGRVARLPLIADVVVIEQIRSYGMSVGAEIFDTVWWSGRFFQEATARGVQVHQLPRLKVKQAICHDSRAKDSNIRAALIDRFGGTPAIRKGGALYGISRDVWSALAIAVTWADQLAGVA